MLLHEARCGADEPEARAGSRAWRRQLVSENASW
jgi:hypothetical protein